MNVKADMRHIPQYPINQINQFQSINKKSIKCIYNCYLVQWRHVYCFVSFFTNSHWYIDPSDSSFLFAAPPLHFYEETTDASLISNDS